MNSIKKYLSKIGKVGGKSNSSKKSEASKNNGKLGGRPKLVKLMARMFGKHITSYEVIGAKVLMIVIARLGNTSFMIHEKLYEPYEVSSDH